MLMRRWTPPSQVPTTLMDDTPTTQTRRTCLRWCKVFISGSIAIALISFIVVYSLQTERFFNQEYQHKQQDNYDQQQRLTFDAYIQDILNILIQNNDKNSIDNKYLLHIQTKTLMVLRSLDIRRKKDILLFLYERNLIQNNQLNLYGADLNNIELTCPHDFHYLHLLGVHCSNAIFINCHLISANFDRAYLINVRFINSTLYNASFIETNLDHSQFIQTIIRNVDFSGASLIQANFLQADIVQGNNFSNADLYQANLTNSQLEGRKVSIIRHDFSHGRYPNGSFELLDSNENFIVNGNAEMECSTDKQTIWKTIDGSTKLSTNNITTNDHHWGNCSFIISAETRVYQTINLPSYSLLIDTNNAGLSFLAYANCNQSYFGMNIYRSDGILLGLKTYSKPMEAIDSDDNKTMHQYGEYEYHLPIHTRLIEIYFGIEIFEVNMKCYFDNITLTIHQNSKN